MSSASLTLAELEHHAQGWLLDGEIRQLSPRTLEARRDLVQKLLWFLRHREAAGCGLAELRAFLAYLNRGHEAEGGRWGNERMTKPVKPSTVQTYFVNLKTLFAFIVSEGALEASPFEKLKPPVSRSDQVQPFTEEQVEAILQAARRSAHPRRNELVVLFLLDTGMRVSELCSLKIEDLDLQGRRCTVVGKGKKRRSLYFGGKTTRALWAYLRERPDHSPTQPLFVADSGRKPGEALTRSGVLQLIHRLGKAAAIEAARCSPHTFRHTFAVTFLRNGGNIFTLKELLGHTTLAMVNRYVALAQADLEAQHRQFSPADRMGRKKR